MPFTAGSSSDIAKKPNVCAGDKAIGERRLQSRLALTALHKKFCSRSCRSIALESRVLKSRVFSTSDSEHPNTKTRCSSLKFFWYQQHLSLLSKTSRSLMCAHTLFTSSHNELPNVRHVQQPLTLEKTLVNYVIAWSLEVKCETCRWRGRSLTLKIDSGRCDC